MPSLVNAVVQVAVPVDTGWLPQPLIVFPLSRNANVPVAPVGVTVAVSVTPLLAPLVKAGFLELLNETVVEVLEALFNVRVSVQLVMEILSVLLSAI